MARRRYPEFHQAGAGAVGRRSLKETFLALAGLEGTMNCFVTCPETGGPFPAVILFMDVWGPREELFDIARRVATVGYCCVVADLLYGQGRDAARFTDDS